MSGLGEGLWGDGEELGVGRGGGGGRGSRGGFGMKRWACMLTDCFILGVQVRNMYSIVYLISGIFTLEDSAYYPCSV